MTNPNNAVGTNAAYSGRTSVNAFNDLASAFTGRGVISGWGCEPSSGMTVAIGGDGSTRDVALAEDVAGNFTTVNNISASPIPVTIPAAPATNSRIDSIVAYVVKPPIGVSTATDNPAACGLIAVSGTVSASPSAPNDSAIRTAITADGASGSTAYYVILANITVASGTTTITDDLIENGAMAKLASSNIDLSTMNATIIMSLTSKYLPVTFARYGDLVFVTANYTTSNWQSKDEVTLIETLPSGYRPITETAFTVVEVVSSDASGGGQGFVFAPDGSITFSSPPIGNNGARLQGSTCWITSDAMPAQ